MTPGGISGIGARRPRIRRDWRLARAKVDAAGCCRNCGRTSDLEAAHVIGREHDADPPVGGRGALYDDGSKFWAWREYLVVPERIIPLCADCHRGPNGQHAKRLDVLPLLTVAEQVQAVADAGGIVSAKLLLSPGPRIPGEGKPPAVVLEPEPDDPWRLLRRPLGYGE